MVLYFFLSFFFLLGLGFFLPVLLNFSTINMCDFCNNKKLKSLLNASKKGGGQLGATVALIFSSSSLYPFG